MAKVRAECSMEGTVPLYHYTMPAIAPMIISGGFRMSTQGQGDGGVYFSTLGPSSYELGAEIYEENIIVDCFGKERLEEYRGKHKLDLLFVYGVHPKVVEQAPGGRENAKMVSTSLFNDLAVPALDGNFFLRPDNIKAAILLDGTSGLPGGREECLSGLEAEKLADRAVQRRLASAAAGLAHNADAVKRALRAMALKQKIASNFRRGGSKVSGGGGGGGGEAGGAGWAKLRSKLKESGSSSSSPSGPPKGSGFAAKLGAWAKAQQVAEAAGESSSSAQGAAAQPIVLGRQPSSSHVRSPLAMLSSRLGSDADTLESGAKQDGAPSDLGAEAPLEPTSGNSSLSAIAMAVAVSQSTEAEL